MGRYEENRKAREDFRAAVARLRDDVAEVFRIHQLLDWLGRMLEKADRALTIRRW